MKEGMKRSRKYRGKDTTFHNKKSMVIKDNKDYLESLDDANREMFGDDADYLDEDMGDK